MDEHDPFDGAALGLRRAGLGIRIVGKLCDGLVFTIVATTLNYVRNFAATRPQPLSAAFVSIVVVAWYALVLVLETRRGYSPGKYVVGLRVRNFDGTNPTLFQSLVRNAYIFVGTIPVVGQFLGIPAVLGIMATIWRDPDGRGWHDRIAGVLVLQVPPPGRFEVDDDPG